MAAMVNARLEAGPLKGGVGVRRPALAPSGQGRSVFPLAELLGSPAIGRDRPHRGHDVRVRISHRLIDVDRQVGDRPRRGDLGGDPRPRELTLLIEGELGRKRDLELPGKLGVLPLLAQLDLVPQVGSRSRPGGRVGRGEDLGMGYPLEDLKARLILSEMVIRGFGPAGVVTMSNGAIGHLAALKRLIGTQGLDMAHLENWWREQGFPFDVQPKEDA